VIGGAAGSLAAGPNWGCCGYASAAYGPLHLSCNAAALVKFGGDAVVVYRCSGSGMLLVRGARGRFHGAPPRLLLLLLLLRLA
jgi:hypothetical protein